MPSPARKSSPLYVAVIYYYEITAARGVGYSIVFDPHRYGKKQEFNYSGHKVLIIIICSVMVYNFITDPTAVIQRVSCLRPPTWIFLEVH